MILTLGRPRLWVLGKGGGTKREQEGKGQSNNQRRRSVSHAAEMNRSNWQTSISSAGITLQTKFTTRMVLALSMT